MPQATQNARQPASLYSPGGNQPTQPARMRESEHDRSTGVLNQDRMCLDPNGDSNVEENRSNDVGIATCRSGRFEERKTSRPKSAQAVKNSTPENFEKTQGNAEDGTGGYELWVRTKRFPVIKEFDDGQEH